MTKRKKVALFGGSFNPIHIGHLALANFICENKYVDELWFLLTPENPLKKSDNLVNEQLRLKMVELAIDSYSKFFVSDFEFQLPRPSYTINTLRALERKYPNYEFYWVLGADNWLIIDKWKDSDQIIKDFNLIIYPRMGYTIEENTLPKNVVYINSPIIEVSSTFIRENIRKGKDMLYFLHPSVSGFIKQNSLYK